MTYRVTIIIAALGVRETYTIEAPREGIAKTRAIATYLRGDNVHPEFSGSFVDYEIEALS